MHVVALGGAEPVFLPNCVHAIVKRPDLQILPFLVLNFCLQVVEKERELFRSVKQRFAIVREWQRYHP
jgi:hypothetical protein